MDQKMKREHDIGITIPLSHKQTARVRIIMGLPDIDTDDSIEIRERCHAFLRELEAFNQKDMFDTGTAGDRDHLLDPITEERIFIPKVASLAFAVLAAAHIAEGAADRWSERRLKGLEDHELSDALKFEFGEETTLLTGSSVFPGKIIPETVVVVGKRSPQLWMDPSNGDRGRPTTSGKNLIDLARDVLKIDRPKAKSKKKTAKKKAGKSKK